MTTNTVETYNVFIDALMTSPDGEQVWMNVYCASFPDRDATIAYANAFMLCPNIRVYTDLWE